MKYFNTTNVHEELKFLIKLPKKLTYFRKNYVEYSIEYLTNI